MVQFRQTRVTSTCSRCRREALVLRLPLIRSFALLHYCQVINSHVGHLSLVLTSWSKRRWRGCDELPKRQVVELAYEVGQDAFDSAQKCRPKEGPRLCSLDGRTKGL